MWWGRCNSHVYVELPCLPLSDRMELLLFTVLTPLYITLIYDVMSQRRLRWGYAFSALLAVIGAGIVADRVTDHFGVGFRSDAAFISVSYRNDEINV